MIDGMRPERDVNKVIEHEQERQSTLAEGNFLQSTSKLTGGRWATMIDGIRPKKDADKPIMTVQLTQSMSAVVQRKTTKATIQTTKPTSQTTKAKDSEMGKEDEQETVGENKIKTEEEVEKEEIYQEIQSMVASGISIKAIEELIFSGKTETKKRQRGL
jgi:hypothetical protein